ncbi:MAG: hypothetical protein V1908_03855, partial [Candidatus Peregrinibacteria bacterium]
MDFSCFNHRNPANAIPCFEVNRLAYRATSGEVAPDVDVQARDRAAEERKLKEADAVIEGAEKEREKMKELAKKVDEARDKYNKFIGKNNLSPAYKLNKAAKDGQALKDEIDGIFLAIPSSKPWASDDELEARGLLGTLDTKAKEYIAQNNAVEEKIRQAHDDREKLTEQSGDNMVERQRLVIQQSDTKVEYEKREVYTRYRNHYEAIVGKDDELKAFWELPRQGYSSQREREMRQLLFAILSQNTKGFTDGANEGFILGPDFTSDDPEKNRQRFPFIYERWAQNPPTGFEHGGRVNRSAINELQNKVNEKTAELERDGIQDVATLLADEVTWKEIDLSDFPAALTGTKTAQEQIDYHEQRKEKIEHYINVCLRRAGEAKDEKGPHIPEGRYRTHAEQLKRHVALEETQIRLWREKIPEDDALRTFTRAELSKHEQWCMEQVMRQLQKAAEIVDTPIAGHGNQEPIYHPEVRRVLIAMVYQEGTASLKDGVYSESTADEYLWMLNELAKSDHFNVNLRGRFTMQGESKDMMMIAREGNLLHIRMPAQEREVARLKAKADALSLNVYAEPTDNAAAETAYAKRTGELETTLAQEAFSTQWTNIQARLASVPAAELTALGLDASGAAPTDPNDVLTKIDDVIAQAAKDELKLPATTPRAELVNRGKMWAEQNPNTPAGRALRIADLLQKTAIQEALVDPTGNAAKAIAELEYIRERERLRVWKRDLGNLESYIKNPKSPESQAFIKSVRTAPNVEGQYGGSHIDEFASFSNGVEYNYNLFDHRNKSNLDYLDRMGIHAEALYQEYLAFIAKNPDMKVDRWDAHLVHSDWNEFKK